MGKRKDGRDGDNVGGKKEWGERNRKREEGRERRKRTR